MGQKSIRNKTTYQSFKKESKVSFYWPVSFLLILYYPLLTNSYDMKYIVAMFSSFTDPINNQNQIYMQLYLNAEVTGKTGLILCSHHQCLNMVVLLQVQSLQMKNLRLHRRKQKTAEPLKNQEGSSFAQGFDLTVQIFILLLVCESLLSFKFKVLIDFMSNWQPFNVCLIIDPKN